MTIKANSIVRVKYSGETVYVLGEANSAGSVQVRRARITRDGIEYIPEIFRKEELEPVEENIQREFKEGVYRQQIMNDYIKSQETVATDKADEFIQ